MRFIQILPNQNKVWLQSDSEGATFPPFRLDIKNIAIFFRFFRINFIQKNFSRNEMTNCTSLNDLNWNMWKSN